MSSGSLNTESTVAHDNEAASIESKSHRNDDTHSMGAPEETRPHPSAISNEKTEDGPEPKPEDTFPEGGLHAWLVAAGTACVLFATLGYSNCFGIFQSYYTLHQLEGETPDNISWIGSTQMVVMFITGCISGPLFDRYGSKIIRPAAILYLFAVMMTSLCKEYYQFILAQGILTGFGCGLLMIPSMSALTQYFNARRGAAMGVAMVGSSIGAIVFPVILSSLLTDTNLGFGWSFRIGGFVMLPPLVFAAFTIRSRLPPRKSSFFLPRAFLKPTYSLLVAGIFFLMTGFFAPLVYLPTYAVANGMNESLASYLVAMVNGASIPGRVIPGILGDKFGRFNLLLAAGLSTSILGFCWIKATSTAGIIVLSVAFGFASGAIISGASIVLTQCTDDPKEVGTYMGQGIAVGSLSVLVSLPATGAFLRTYGGFEEISIFCGAMTMAGVLLIIGAKVTTKEGVLGRI